MQQVKLIITMQDIQRYKILQEMFDRKMTAVQAAVILGLSRVHVSRLKKRFSEGGLEGILRKAPQSMPNKQVSDSQEKQIVKLRKEIYYDFNILHFTEKLNELHNIAYCHETIRQILIRHDLHIARQRKIIHRTRRRMPKAGMLLQMDSSEHKWLPNIADDWSLISMIDDATNEIAYAQLYPKDTTFANMSVIRRHMEVKGLFYALYVDKASHFTTTRLGGLHNTTNQEQSDTQIERALGELGIKLIPANSPQAKGRIERSFRLFQDRFIKEMRLAGIKDYENANKFLTEQFLPWYNGRFTHQAESVYMPLPKDINLDLIFCIKIQRTVKNDNTIQVHSQTIQIPPSKMALSFSKRILDVGIMENQKGFVLYKNKIVADFDLANNPLAAKKEQHKKLLINRKYIAFKPKYHPASNHPWRKFKYPRTIRKLRRQYFESKNGHV